MVSSVSGTPLLQRTETERIINNANMVYINLNLYKNTQLYIIGCKARCLFCNLLIFSVYCGETGIRTPGSVTFNGFQDRRNRPLCHLSKTSLSEVLSVESGAKVRIIFKSANILIFFSRINRIFAVH